MAKSDDSALSVAPCPVCGEYTKLVGGVYGAGGAGVRALRLGCGHDIGMDYMAGIGPFADCGIFPDDPDLAQEALYDE